MKRFIHMLPVLLAVSPLVVGSGYELLPQWHQQPRPRQELKWVAPDYQGDLTSAEKEMLMALKNYEDAVAKYGSDNRVAQVAASDLEAAIEIYLETQKEP